MIQEMIDKLELEWDRLHGKVDWSQKEAAHKLTMVMVKIDDAIDSLKDAQKRMEVIVS